VVSNGTVCDLCCPHPCTEYEKQKEEWEEQCIGLRAKSLVIIKVTHAVYERKASQFTLGSSYQH